MAAILNTIPFGIGYLYLRRFKRFIIFQISGFVIGFLARYFLGETSNLVLGIYWLGSIIDAYIIIKKMNEENFEWLDIFALISVFTIAFIIFGVMILLLGLFVEFIY